MCCSLFSLHRQTTFILIINDMLYQIMEIYFQIGVTAIRSYIGTDHYPAKDNLSSLLYSLRLHHSEYR